MITEVHLSGLRGVREGALVEMSPLTVMVGASGSGKSTVLDALLIGAGNSPAEGVGRAVQRRRGSWNGAQWLLRRAEGVQQQGAVRVIARRPLGSQERRTRIDLHDGVPPNEGATLPSGAPAPWSSFLLSMSDEGVESRHCWVGIAADNLYQAGPVMPVPLKGWELRMVDLAVVMGTPLHKQYSEMVKSGRRSEVVEVLREVVGTRTLRDLTLLTEGEVPIVHLEFDDGAVPVALASDGVASMVRLAVELASRPGGLVLIEEPELHQHPKLQWLTARVIWAAVCRGVQVVLTTHSLDLIDGLVSAAPPDRLGDLSLHRTALVEAGRLAVSRISGARVAARRAEFEEDLR
jgi:ABC-type ATPase involved in cell division